MNDIQCDHCGLVYDEQLPACPQCRQANPFFGDAETAYPDDPYDDRYNDAYAPYQPEDNTFLHEELYPNDDLYHPDDDLYPNERNFYTPPAADYAAAVAAPPYAPYDEFVDEYDIPPAVNESPASERRWYSTLGRLLVGCAALFGCFGLYYGGIGVYAVFQGYQEQLVENQTERELYYNRGQAFLESGNLERAIAEFEYALSLDPDYTAARLAKREAEARLDTTTPSTVTTPGGANLDTLFQQAEAHIQARRWPEAVQTLSQVRSLDLSYRDVRVSEMLYTANYQLGLQQLAPEFLDEAANSFQRALVERPGDERAQTEYDKIQRYLQGRAALPTNEARAIENLSELYDLDADYLDVRELLLQAYEANGDRLALEGEWCQAELQYAQAVIIEPSSRLQAKTDNSGGECLINGDASPPTQPTATRRAATPTPDSPTTPPPESDSDVESDSSPAVASAASAARESESAGAADEDEETEETESAADETEERDPAESEAAPVNSAGVSGTILYTEFNRDENEWHILSVPAAGGNPRFVERDGIQPAISKDGRFMLYRSTLPDAIGLHQFDFFTGESTRITILQQDQLPRFGSDSGQFVFAAQEPTTGRWRVHQGFTNGITDPKILNDGRTPDWSAEGALVYRGTTPDGNNPGLYVANFLGGAGERITTHPSDRSPAFSPDGGRIAYMSTMGGNWDVYIINKDGGEPQQITDYAGNDGLPVWSPDGSHLAYVSDEGGQWSIYTIPAAGGEPSQVTTWSGLQRADWLSSQIAWSPNP